jgi:hypothetical protein
MLFVFFYEKQIVSLFTDGILVKYQRVTGPELVVLKGEKKLQKQNEQASNKNISYSELFVIDDLDETSEVKLKSSFTYIIQGELIDYKPITPDSDVLYPIIKINYIVTKIDYYILGSLFLLFLSGIFLSSIGLIISFKSI